MKCLVCNSKDKKKSFGAYHECTICNSLFVKDTPSQSLKNERVDKDARIMLESKNDEKNINTSRLQRLEKFISKKSTILDVGCGYGSFLLQVKNSHHTPIAMDVSKKLIKHLETNGIRGYTRFDEIKKNSIDVATSFDVIEHTTNPQKFIEEIKKVLKNNSIIMITTPNRLGISGRLLRDNWWVFGPDGHYVLFSPQSLRHILEKNNFEVLSLKSDMFTAWFTPSDTIIKKLCNKLLFILFSLVKNNAYNHLLGDNIEIIARLKKTE